MFSRNVAQLSLELFKLTLGGQHARVTFLRRLAVTSSRASLSSSSQEKDVTAGVVNTEAAAADAADAAADAASTADGVARMRPKQPTSAIRMYIKEFRQNNPGMVS